MYNSYENFDFDSSTVRFFSHGEEIDEVGEFEVDVNYSIPPLFRFISLEEEYGDGYREEEEDVFFNPIYGYRQIPNNMMPPNIVDPSAFQFSPNYPGNQVPPNYQYNQQGAPGKMPSAAGPMSSPPNFVPSKSESKKYGTEKGVGAYKVDYGAIRPCTNRFIYIWQRNGNAYWAYLTYVGPRSVAGWRWMGFRWVYFGLDLNRIDSFTCY
ncbi:hypothetical protein [Clostridium sp. YIM B02551]|uniref:hypothetical protein n=1 Tax=Clostridium sp. YIM B02551 TaxID=2910679 RepID=UPI001EEA5A5E|nr:hypothetical protein [Clostridium sp. YIM B02551]